MDQETVNKFLRYEALKLQEKEIKAEVAELATDLIAHIEVDEKVNGESGSFAKREKIKWSYTPETKHMELSLKSRKKEEELEGIAEPEVSHFLVYTKKKNSGSEVGEF